jgi:hypothetical protein
MDITSGGNASELIEDLSFEGAVRDAVAEKVGVNSELVTVQLSVGSSRRLGAAASARRLAGTVVVAYTITIPPGSNVQVESVRESLKENQKGALTQVIVNKLSEEGITVEVDVIEMSETSVVFVLAPVPSPAEPPSDEGAAHGLMALCGGAHALVIAMSASALLAL